MKITNCNQSFIEQTSFDYDLEVEIVRETYESVETLTEFYESLEILLEAIRDGGN